MFLIFFLYLAVLVQTREDPQIEISDGKIRGKILETWGGRKFNAFLSIPYAEPPVGPLRFKNPVPKKPWSNVLDGTKSHTICPQAQIFMGKHKAEGSEDCLFLNVYTPRLPSENSDPLPVMVWLHGGGLTVGAGTYEYYQPEILLDHDIVLVSGNYRLGTLGFLSTEDEVSPGNYGFKDQSLILQWVRKNIKHFGGDPKSVTLFGESAGGSSTHYHMFSPLSKGLFKGVISQSGTVLNHWALAVDGQNVRNTKKLAEHFDCPTTPNEELVECLRKVDATTLAEQDTIFFEWGTDPITPFNPVVEPSSPGAFLPDVPKNLLKAGKFADVPWMVGLTTEEGLLRTAAFHLYPKLFDELNEDFNEKAAIALGYRPIVKDINLIGEKIRKFYFGDKKIDLKNTFAELTNMYSDSWFLRSLDESITSYREVSKKPVYNYLFGYKGSTSITKMFGDPKVHGVCHADELLYLFPSIHGMFAERKVTEEEKSVIKLLTTLFVNFARTGNPTPEINDVIKSKWEPVKSDKLEYYFIDSKKSGMRDALYEDRVKFWRDLRSNYLRKTHRDEL